MKRIITALALAGALAAGAEELDRPSGIQIGTRMTLNPYVSLSFTHDSNVDSVNKKNDGQLWTVSPGTSLTYKGGNWGLTGQLYYQYHAYSSGYSKQLNQSSWGESLTYNWSNAQGGGKGWQLMLTESYRFITQDHDAMSDGGRGIGRDRQQADVSGALERRFTDRFHGGVNASYYYLHYDNQVNSYAPLYGWTRWSVGGQVGYVVNKWSDLLLTGNYHGYTQDNDSNKYYEWDKIHNIKDRSKGWTVQGGFGTHATERITYRVLVGYSHYEYCNHSDNAPTYTISGNWKMTDNWNMMLMGSRYYSPSETARGSSALTDTVSWGLAHSMVRGKLTATFDLAYRRQEHPYNTYSDNDYRTDIGTARFGLNYTINRFVGVFGSLEYQKSWYSGPGGLTSQYDYDRWRATVGMRLTY